MVLDIHRPLTDEYGDIDEAEAEDLEAELMDLFAESPEAQPIIEQLGDVGWADLILQYGRTYESVTVTTMGKRELSRVLLDIVPRKVSCEPSVAHEIIAELRAFWSFLGRELGLANADECLAVLDDDMARSVERELADPRNFGMAKSLVMSGMAAGFDMTTKEGLDAFMAHYKANLPMFRPNPAPAPAQPRPMTRAEKNKKKARRRAQRKSRQKSR